MSDPRTREVAATLAAEIAGLPKGTRVPSEHQLMARFDISRSIARAALQQLERQYLVRRAQGTGTFVHQRLDYVISRQRRPSLRHQITESGSRSRTFLLTARADDPPAEVRDRLGGTARLTRLERLSYLDDDVVTFLQEWFADGVAPHLEVGMNVIDSVEELLRGLRFEPVRSWCRVTVAVPPGRICERLELDPGAYAWSVDSLIEDGRSGQPLFYSSNWTRIDLIRFVCEL